MSTIRPSDTVRWSTQQDHRGIHARWNLHRLSGADRFQERRPDEVQGDGTFKCWLTMNESGDFLTDLERSMDPDARVWTCTTQGEHKGGRRHRDYLTFSEAQTAALAWLDRRFTL